MHINDLTLIDELHEVFQDDEGQKYIHNGNEFITIEENTKEAIMEAIEGEKINTVGGVETYIQDYIEIHRELPYITQIDEEAINEIIEDKLRSLITDKEVVLEAVKDKGEVLFWASVELRSDKEVALEAVKQNGYALQYASDELRNDKDVVIEAVKQHGYALQYASNELKNNKDVVIEAVKQDGWALRHASDELKNNKEVVLEAVKKNEKALSCASDDLRNDRDVLNVARDYLMSEDCPNSEIYINAKENLLKYDREDELKQKIADLDKIQAQQNSINQPKAEVKSRRKI